MNPQSFRDGVRWLIAKPIPTLLAGVVLALALGIGTVAFSVLNAAILRPAPYKDASHIVAVSNFHAQRGADFGVSPGRFQDFRRENRSFEDVAAFRTFNQTFVLTHVGQGELVSGVSQSRLARVRQIATVEVSQEISGIYRVRRQRPTAHRPRALDTARGPIQRGL